MPEAIVNFNILLSLLEIFIKTSDAIQYSPLMVALDSYMNIDIIKESFMKNSRLITMFKMLLSKMAKVKNSAGEKNYALELTRLVSTLSSSKEECAKLVDRSSLGSIF